MLSTVQPPAFHQCSHHKYLLFHKIYYETTMEPFSPFLFSGVSLEDEEKPEVLFDALWNETYSRQRKGG